MRFEEMTDVERTKGIDRLQKRHPGTRRQRNDHGVGNFSVQFFDKETGELVADYQLTPRLIRMK